MANTSQRGAVASLTASRRNRTASQLNTANSSTAPAKPPTAISPSVRSLLAASNSAAKPATPTAKTPMEAGFRLPTSRRMTRSGGTCASCNTGGSPNASSKVDPMPSPSSNGQTVAAGSDASTRPLSIITKRLCTP